MERVHNLTINDRHTIIHMDLGLGNETWSTRIRHIESETGDSAVDREVKMKLMEQRVIELEKKQATLRRDVTRINKRR